jgi:hypothetical protein
MSLVVVERAFVEPVAFADIQAKEDAGQWCLDSHRVRFVFSLFARDRKRMVCLYQAPDAEAVRAAQRTLAMPVASVWAATALMPDRALGAEAIVVERAVPSPITIDQVRAMEQASAWCFEAHRVEPLQTYLSADHMKALCVFRAPDAESVRLANREAALPVASVWPAELHPAR